VIVDCFWEFEVILPNGFFLLGILCFLGEVWIWKLSKISWKPQGEMEKGGKAKKKRKSWEEIRVRLVFCWAS
jgi:hypothetical protein